jgi:hypothetical protein
VICAVEAHPVTPFHVHNELHPLSWPTSQ